MPKAPLSLPVDPPPDGVPPVVEADFMVIDLGRRRRWLGWVGYALLFAAVAGVFVMLFVMLTASLRVALAVVGFMMLYMFIAAKVAEGRLDIRPEVDEVELEADDPASSARAGRSSP